jgi:hypothetical protein
MDELYHQQLAETGYRPNTLDGLDGWTVKPPLDTGLREVVRATCEVAHRARAAGVRLSADETRVVGETLASLRTCQHGRWCRRGLVGTPSLALLLRLGLADERASRGGIVVTAARQRRRRCA